MAHSILTYPGDGTTTQFALNFTLGYLSRDHIQVRVGNEVDGSGNPVYRAVTYVNDNLIDVQGAVPAIGEDVVITRTVDPTLPYNDWADDAIIDELTLDENQKQALMLMHEILDGRISSIRTDLDMGNNAVTMVKDPVNLQDAANKQYVDGLIPTGASNAAAAQAAQAAAETARDTAQDHRDDANTAKTAAAVSASAAANSATDATTSATNAANSASAANASETNAASSASAASTSSSNAATSATNADASASAASTSASNAVTSETNAASSASAAASSASSASASASSAAASWDSFDDVYLGSKASDPALDNDGDPLTEGALYWNSSNKRFRVYNGTDWEDATNTVNRGIYKYTATAGQTVFAGLDDGGQTLDLTDTFYTVYLNGVRLVDVDDYTKADASITLVSGVLAGDELVIEAYTQFSVADVVRKTGDTMSGDLNMGGNNITHIASLNGGPLVGFRNKIINGDFDIWQRGTTVSGLTNHYGPDRWAAVCASGITCQAARSTRQVGRKEEYYGTFTFTGTGSAGSTVQQRIESVNTLSGKTVTVSGELAMDSTQTVNIYLRQYFGSGGAPSATVDTLVGIVTAPAAVAWQAFSLKVDLPSVVGKTVGSSNDDSLQLLFELSQPNGRTLHLKHLSLVEGDATSEVDPFEKRPLAIEETLCQRYFEVVGGSGRTFSTANNIHPIPFAVLKRAAPTVTRLGDFSSSSETGTTTTTSYPLFPNSTDWQTRGIIAYKASPNSGDYIGGIFTADAEI